MKIKVLLLLSTVVFGVSVAHARPQPDRPGVCITFKGDNVVSKDLCLVSYDEGAGGNTTDLKTFNKSYVISGTQVMNPRSEARSDHFKYTVNNEASFGEYHRSADFYSVEDIDEIREREDEYLTCYKTKSVDICYN